MGATLAAADWGARHRERWAELSSGPEVPVPSTEVWWEVAGKRGVQVARAACHWRQAEARSFDPDRASWFFLPRDAIRSSRRGVYDAHVKRLIAFMEMVDLPRGGPEDLE